MCARPLGSTAARARATGQPRPLAGCGSSGAGSQQTLTLCDSSSILGAAARRHLGGCRLAGLRAVSPPPRMVRRAVRRMVSDLLGRSSWRRADSVPTANTSMSSTGSTRVQFEQNAGFLDMLFRHHRRELSPPPPPVLATQGSVRTRRPKTSRLSTSVWAALASVSGRERSMTARSLPSPARR